jgi:prepilin-type N-terminal cleavage/methylation domain-containing protein/prepilin-type processing-associated H-X9-DG protein
MPSLHSRRAFTFIELLVAMTIIVILGAILFPVFAKAQEKARQTTCLANLHNIGAALRMYAVENYGHLPPTSNDFAPLLIKHLPDPAALICPTLYGPKPPIQFPTPVPDELLARCRACGYVYRGGLMDDDNPLSIVAADLFGDVHNDGANYLWIDGHGKWMKSGGSLFGTETTESQTSNVEAQHIDDLRRAVAGRAGIRYEELPDEAGPPFGAPGGPPGPGGPGGPPGGPGGPPPGPPSGPKGGPA